MLIASNMPVGGAKVGPACMAAVVPGDRIVPPQAWAIISKARLFVGAPWPNPLTWA
jgi:hypothetical protein